MKITKPFLVASVLIVTLSGCTSFDSLTTDIANGLNGSSNNAQTAPNTTGSTIVADGKTPELTEGPYYLSGNFTRKDITAGQEGLAQEITFLVTDTNGKPITDAKVDLWHANALGVYSGVEGNSDTFLRGSQTTNSEGYVTFKTIFAGWYGGRTVHYHVKVWRAGQQVLTTQFFVTKEDSDKVYTTYAPYKSKGLQDTTNEQDQIASSVGTALSGLTLKNEFAADSVKSTANIVL
jgi:protocatechuate 3,4-dioxygenase beta subunit